MALDPEKMKSMIAFKKRLEEQLEKLTAETTEIQANLDAVNQILLEKGFKRGDLKESSEVPAIMPKEVILPKHEPETQKPATPEAQSVIPLKTMSDEPLALMYFDEQSIHVLPDESKNFSVTTPPFSNFLVERVFTKMQDKDKELARLGELKPEKMFTYTIVREGELIREIIIKNVDEERLKELKSSIRWTFEKMYEKVKGT